jgi:hypothetical protein
MKSSRFFAAHRLAFAISLAALMTLAACASQTPAPKSAIREAPASNEVALVPVSVCGALTLYGNAVDQGVCLNLSPATQNHWVCELVTTPDIHLTFNKTTDLHVTVRDSRTTPPCDENSYLTGAFPAQLKIDAGQKKTLCTVPIQPIVDQLNTIPELQPSRSQSKCVEPFAKAVEDLRLSPSLAQTYIDRCKEMSCP